MEEEDNNQAAMDNLIEDRSITPESPWGKFKSYRPSQTVYKVLVAIFVTFGIACGYMAGIHPVGAGWRLFSWHPLLMVMGMVGLFGPAIVTKKLGGYDNTKIHGIIAMFGCLFSFGGLYCIYLNKQRFGNPHLHTTHSKMGAVVAIGCLIIAIVGSVFLHPDFGIDKSNKMIRTLHKWFARALVMLAWITMFLGLRELNPNTLTQVVFLVPLVLLAPVTLA